MSSSENTHTKSFSIKFNKDKLYTNDNIAKYCISNITDLSKYAGVLEPSAGAGSFYKNIIHPNKIGLDIDPECDDVQTKDFFEYDHPLDQWVVIGNPPFGKRNNLSIRFIKHAESLNAATIAFILPNVFKKHTLQKHITYNITNIIPLPEDSFSYQGSAYSIGCSFYILEKNGPDLFRFNPGLYKTNPDFEFVNKNESYDFFIMGAAPHTTKTIVGSTNRGYYIKCKIPPEIVKSNIQAIEWKKIGNSSAGGGVSWFTQPEIAKAYIEKYHPNIILSP